jgi:HlyD family secretion protein
MRLFIRLLIIVAILGAAGWGASYPLGSYMAERNRPTYREAKVRRRTITKVVNCTGEVKPVLSVAIGSFVSGPVKKLYVDFNDWVKEGQLLAEIDTKIYDAAVKRDQASLLTAQADILRIKALLQQAINDERRSIALREENPDFISQTDIDRFHFTRLSLAAQLEVAKAVVKQAEANLENSQANVKYAMIEAPVDGIVIDKKIDSGQTLAAQFQTPELFTIAPKMDEKMHIFASVDEADIGMIREAQVRGLPVEFTVYAYPDDLFTGKIEQIRFSSTVTQNVVTYSVVVASPNPDLKLMPGMTAELSFRVDEREDVLCVPNGALRFYPVAEQVREEDRKLLDGADEESDDQEEEPELSARERSESGNERNRRHVWVVDGKLLKAIEIVTGVDDSHYTEVVSGDLKENQKLVTRVNPPT